MTDNWTRVIDNLIEIRHRKGITQSALAQMCGVKRPVITRFEQKNHVPQIDTLTKVAAALGCKIKISVIPDDE